MSIEVVVPDMGEAGVEATVSRWLKAVGEAVKAGEAVVVLETDKVDLEVAADADGTLESIEREAGQDVEVGEVLGRIDETSKAASATQPPQEQTPVAEGIPAAKTQESEPARDENETTPKATPVAKRMAEKQSINLTQVEGSGVRGRVTREDIEKYQSQQKAARDDGQKSTAEAPARNRSAEEERVPMSRRRRTIARRLVEAQQTAAMLTTFNDVDISAVMDMRRRRKEAFQERHGVSLGLSAFFVKASIGALKAFPQLNAEIEGDDIILKNYYDIGVAIGAEDGLVVPVLRNADRMSFAEIESSIKRYAKQTSDGTLSLEDLRGGTFTITNGGIFGSLLSTPILNPPQVAILGLHRIEDRPIALNGEVAIRPMMYLALSYDHRIVDGREAVQFLARIKQLVEDPEVLLIEG